MRCTVHTINPLLARTVHVGPYLGGSMRITFAWPGRRAIRLVTVAALAGGIPALAAASSSAASSITPFVNCVAQNPALGIDVAYFGYDDTESQSTNLDVGDYNEFIPGNQDQGQPTDFTPGASPIVATVEFDPTITPSVTWALDGNQAQATADSPVCTDTVTSPASALTDTGATLNGVVTPGGEDTTYEFVYGTSATSLSTDTAVTDAGSAAQGTLVQATLGNLSPSTTYYYRLDSTNASYSAPGRSAQLHHPGRARHPAAADDLRPHDHDDRTARRDRRQAVLGHTDRDRRHRPGNLVDHPRPAAVRPQPARLHRHDHRHPAQSVAVRRVDHG